MWYRFESELNEKIVYANGDNFVRPPSTEIDWSYDDAINVLKTVWGLLFIRPFVSKSFA